MNGDLIAYSLKGYEDSQKISSDASVISRPYNGEKLSFTTGNFDNVNQLRGTIKRTVGLPNFSFREVKSTGKYEMGFTGIPDGRGVHIGYKMDSVTSNRLMKSDETKAYFG